jgi:hypothetical protein
LSTDTSLAAIGRFIVGFSQLERNVGLALLSALDLESRDGTEALLALSTFRPKLETLKAIISAGKSGGVVAEEDLKLVHQVSEISDFRNRLAHGAIAIADDGAISISHMNSGKHVRPPTVTVQANDLDGKTEAMGQLGQALVAMMPAYRNGMSRSFVKMWYLMGG